ncbi:MAG: hypothetical protein CMP20_04910 [Rickettsiales bacterium]|nr:hypothetical protein [Rickettsiales bacterium]
MYQLWRIIRPKPSLTFTVTVGKTQISLDKNRLYINGKLAYTSPKHVTGFSVKGRSIRLNNTEFYVLGKVVICKPLDS